MAPLSEWNKAVQTAFKMGRKTNKKYSLKQAMFSAKKFYKKGMKTVMNVGRRQTRRRSSKRYRGGSGIKTELSHSDVNASNQSSAPQSSSVPQSTSK